MNSIKIKVTEFLYEVGQISRQNCQALSPAHIFYYCLKKKSSESQGNTKNVLGQAINEIEKNVLPNTQLEKISSDHLDTTFSQTDALASSLRFLSKYKISGSIYNGILWWLIHDHFDDHYGLGNQCRKICRKHGVPALFSTSGSTHTSTIMGQTQSPDQNTEQPLNQSDPLIFELGFGEVIQPIHEKSNEILESGRKLELEKHLGFLQMSILQGNHYLLEGTKGTGKSHFLKILLGFALTRFSKSTDVVLNRLKFIYFDRRDFIGSESRIEERLEKLDGFFQANPDVIPAFDGLEYLLNTSFSIHESFLSLFGGVLTGGGRTFALSCLTSIVEKSDILSSIRRFPLPSLPRKESHKVIVRELTATIKTSDILNEVENSADRYADYLLTQAVERYPTMAFPGIALNLLDSAVNRAINRIRFLEKDPEPILKEKDLWEHISEELGLDLEVFGKDPEEFYQELPNKIKDEVIGQDHAIDIITKALDDQRKRPASQMPRGRFMFLGPPGVGKTQLAKSIAKNLGYGEDAFIILNMSEYSSETARTRFMGSDPGYVGYGNTRTIYDMVKSRPCSVVLLDEIDRAHSSIQDILLSILEGQGKSSVGEMISFSQVIFIMTTNQGQEQIEKAYFDSLDNHVHRDTLIQNFDDEFLRKLLIKGTVDEREINMKDFLEKQMSIASMTFESGTFDLEKNLEDIQEADLSVMGIKQYLGYRELYDSLEMKLKKTPLDRAFLDRVDFVVPFFPIKETSFVEKIISFKLKQFGWEDCPQKTRVEIQNAVLTPEGSVRMVERLIKKARVQSL